MKSEGKIWGATSEIIKNSFVEVHRAEIVKGGVCSRHLHQYKINSFFVESGKLLIKKFQDGDIIDETILQQGDLIEVMPNVKHQFEGLEDSVIFEVYYPMEIGDIDIVRFTQGFLK